MCCRYYMECSPELKPIVDRAKASPLHNTLITALGRPLKTEGEVHPADIAPVIAPAKKDHSATVFPMLWGFSHPKGGSPVVNARVETAAQKGMWKESWHQRRCVIPASYYFEWEHLISPDGKKKAGQKYMIQPRGCIIVYLAGLYGMEEHKGVHVPVFTVLTREPSEEIRFIHDRMPVILSKDFVRAWINPESDPVEIASTALTDMVYEKV